MIGLTAHAGDHFKNRATIPLAPCTVDHLPFLFSFGFVIFQKEIDHHDFEQFLTMLVTCPWIYQLENTII
jgi:hypothetical protein